MNIMITIGATSVLYWLSDRSTISVIAKHRSASIQIAGIAYVTFLFIAYRFNYQLDQNYAGFGVHWTFLNMILVAVYVLLLYAGNVIQASVWMLIMGVYYFGFAQTITAAGIASYLIFDLAVIVLMLMGKKLMTKRTYFYPALTVFVAIGTFCVYTMRPRDLSGWFWVRQVGALAVLAIISYEYSQIMSAADNQYRRARFRATHDELTGLANLALFNTDLANHFTAFQNDGPEFTMFELDIDHFKQINDTYGHLAGNAVLQAIARELTTCTNSAPVPATAYRLGGEEFGVIMLGALTEERIHAMAEHFLKQLDQVRIDSVDPDLRITGSIGCATQQERTSKLFNLYSRADHNLYLAKSAGRNRIAVSTHVYTR
jgi:diguanylate cyclase (GGDEF)-like protein